MKYYDHFLFSKILIRHILPLPRWVYMSNWMSYLQLTLQWMDRNGDGFHLTIWTTELELIAFHSEFTLEQTADLLAKLFEHYEALVPCIYFLAHLLSNMHVMTYYRSEVLQPYSQHTWWKLHLLWRISFFSVNLFKPLAILLNKLEGRQGHLSQFNFPFPIHLFTHSSI